ncbi:MAG: 30S ribosomal protein S30e [Candidatus Bathyarchaeota archaeon]|nr:30S ribosomal protein S30e [Candidatus Bathyarchaeota archaeon]MDH5732556.1 30S ribosomal protein S30e [Candidatus Bathyarchaeota archaeon]
MPTHGSLSKAGKVRSQTPKIPPVPKKSKSPRLNCRRNYEKRIILQRKSGQNWGTTRRRRF